MKRLYRKITGETEAESEPTPAPATLTGLLAAFLSGVLCCMFIHWLLF
jgi:CRISPR-associated Cas5-like protein